MQYLVSAKEMQTCDRNTIEAIGIPALVLMERASLAARDCILHYLIKNHIKNPSVLIIVGMGNNGADGLALARLLVEKEIDVEIVLVGSQEKASEQWKQQMHILEYYHLSIGSAPKYEKYDVCVDALFGVGLTRDIEGEYEKAVSDFNELRGFKLALDIPSGICSDTGKIMGCAVKADKTITFAFVKRGLLLYPGAECVGELEIAEIGITERGFWGEKPQMFSYEQKDLKNLLKARTTSGNKGSFGKVLLIAGSEGMAGAAILCAKAAFRSGAGMVKILTPESNRIIIQETIPEAMLGTYEEYESALKWADVVVVGPGLSTHKTAEVMMDKILRTIDKPLLIDADGLNLLADSDLFKTLCADKECPIVLTPHIGELSRLINEPIPNLKEMTWEYGKKLADELKCTVVAKDARTFICAASGEVCVNTYGNSGMATAGSGDVLAGVIGGLLAQNRCVSPFDTACVGVMVHALAGDCVSEKNGPDGCMAGDIADAVSVVLYTNL